MNVQQFQRAREHGFTLIELMIVIVVIGILTTIAVVAFSSVQANSRDSVRAADVESIQDALEKYYSQNGEYPGCSVINSSTSTLSTLPTVTKDILTTPKATTQGASLRCATSLTPGTDAYAYVGDGSSVCKTGSNCNSYTLEYWDEGSNSIVAVKSRHQAETVTVQAPSGPTTAISYSSGHTSGVPVTVSCSQGTPQYAIRSRFDNGSWSSYTAWGTTPTALSVTAAQGDKVDYQSEARCLLTAEYISSAVVGAAATYLVAIDAPTPPTVTVNTSSPDAAAWSWTSVTCPGTFTPSYRYDWARDDATSWRAWSGAVTATAQSETTTDQGYNYQLKVEARCSSPYVSGTWSADSNVAAYLHAIAAPGVATNFAASKVTLKGSNGKNTNQTLTVTWTDPTCGSGTARRYNELAFLTASLTNPGSGGGVVGWSWDEGELWGIDDSNNSSIRAHWTASNPASGMTSYFSTASAVPAADVANANSQGYYNGVWNFWYPSADTLQTVVNSGDDSSSNQNSWFTSYRVYIRYACINTTTKRDAVGAYTWSPYWTWSS